MKSPKKTKRNKNMRGARGPDLKNKQHQCAETVLIVLLPILLFAGVVALIFLSNNKQMITLSSDLIDCGEYPQTLVEDPNLLKNLNKMELNWTYFDDCFVGNGNYGSMHKTNAMKYADVDLNGQKYRAVLIEHFRSQTTLDEASSESSWQDINGFRLNQTYWFRFEPIKWEVIDPQKRLLLTEKVLDAMPFNKNLFWIDRNFDRIQNWETEYSISKYIQIPCNMYLSSFIRKWLNSAFIDVAFSKNEKRTIKRIFHRADESDENKRYGILSLTYDRAFLLSGKEVSSCFSNRNCFSAPTDYAKCRGVWVCSDNNSETTWWWLRSPGEFSGDVVSVCASYDFYNADRQFFSSYSLGGVRAAICLKNSTYDFDANEVEK